MTVGPAAARRLEVMALRVRLEHLAMRAYDTVCQPPTSGGQGNTKNRLLFVLALAPEKERPAVHRLVHLGRHVYKRSSDVLHGRVAGLDVPDIVIAEWRDVVDALEAVEQPAHGCLAEGSNEPTRTASTSWR